MTNGNGMVTIVRLPTEGIVEPFARAITAGIEAKTNAILSGLMDTMVMAIKIYFFMAAAALLVGVPAVGWVSVKIEQLSLKGVYAINEVQCEGWKKTALKAVKYFLIFSALISAVSATTFLTLSGTIWVVFLLGQNLGKFYHKTSIISLIGFGGCALFYQWKTFKLAAPSFSMKNHTL